MNHSAGPPPETASPIHSPAPARAHLRFTAMKMLIRIMAAMTEKIQRIQSMPAVEATPNSPASQAPIAARPQDDGPQSRDLLVPLEEETGEGADDAADDDHGDDLSDHGVLSLRRSGEALRTTAPHAKRRRSMIAPS